MPKIKTTLLSFLALAALTVTGCTTEPITNTRVNGPASPSPSTNASPTNDSAQVVPVTLPVLDALFSDESFKTTLKSKLSLTDDQIAQLQKISAAEVARLREANAEGDTNTPSSDAGSEATKSREHAAQAIREAIGEEKASQLFAFARDYWVNGNQTAEGNKTEPTNKPLPNSVPTDTRIVVNIPAFRMDVFKDGTLTKSYKIGIGYPEFPLPIGLRKADTIIFNPTWTPPDEPWVDKMKNISVGEKVAAGSKLNPLGPIKIPIGLPSLIHGGKSPTKLGTFASHGCVGLTTPQIQDFAKLLAQISGSDVTDATLKSYLADPTKTRSVKLGQNVPVELRYDTIVLEDGKLHIYRDVYDQDTNTESNLRAVLEANGVKLEDLSEAERSEIMDALKAMSRNPSSIASSSPSSNSNAGQSADNSAQSKGVNNKNAKVETARTRKPVGKNQKEIVIELAEVKEKGYPAPVNLDTGSGKTATVASSRATR